MNYKIKNDCLSVEISSRGGEFQSIKDARNTEYLWQGDPDTWDEKGPNLFPYIGRTTNKTYTYQNREYHLPIHGFLPHAEMELVEQTADSLTMRLTSSPETLEVWPFHFQLIITWKLNGSTLTISYQVDNRDDKTMYFGIGGHPGFRVPLSEKFSYEDYRFDFGEGAAPRQILLSPDCFVLEEDTPLELQNSRYLPLSHALFCNDAIVMKDMPSSIILENPKDSRRITVAFPDMKYLGIWGWPDQSRPAPYVCIEPWSSLPSRKDIVEDISTQPGLISLEAGAQYRNTWSITID